MNDYNMKISFADQAKAGAVMAGSFMAVSAFMTVTTKIIQIAVQIIN